MLIIAESLYLDFLHCVLLDFGEADGEYAIF